MVAALTSESVIRIAKECGADLAGIAGAETLNAFPPDPRWPQTLGRISPDARSVIVLYCKGKLAKFKVPSVINIVVSLPKTPAAKIDKMALRKSFGKS